jgi:hypothetical protein
MALSLIYSQISSYLDEHPGINTETPLGDGLRTCLHAAAWQLDPAAVRFFLDHRPPSNGSVNALSSLICVRESMHRLTNVIAGCR